MPDEIKYKNRIPFFPSLFPNAITHCVYREVDLLNISLPLAFLKQLPLASLSVISIFYLGRQLGLVINLSSAFHLH